MITQNLLHEIFDYKDGNLYWKIKPSKNRCIGDKVGHVSANGYSRTKINEKSYLIHRLIFLYHHGFMPEYIDHIDNNNLNNRIENLRQATPSENSYNRKLVKNNTSGVKNVCWNKLAKKWQVRITVKKQQLHIGLFDDLELAELVAIEAKDKFHGNFARFY